MGAGRYFVYGCRKMNTGRSGAIHSMETKNPVFYEKQPHRVIMVSTNQPISFLDTLVSSGYRGPTAQIPPGPGQKKVPSLPAKRPCSSGRYPLTKGAAYTQDIPRRKPGSGKEAFLYLPSCLSALPVKK